MQCRPILRKWTLLAECLPGESLSCRSTVQRPRRLLRSLHAGHLSTGRHLREWRVSRLLLARLCNWADLPQSAMPSRSLPWRDLCVGPVLFKRNLCAELHEFDVPHGSELPDGSVRGRCLCGGDLSRGFLLQFLDRDLSEAGLSECRVRGWHGVCRGQQQVRGKSLRGGSLPER